MDEDINDSNNDGIEEIGIGEAVIPYIKILISVGRENHDMLTIPEISNLLTQDGASPTQNIKDFLDKGMVNIYACEYDKVAKIL
jgi:DNA-binding MarR family transcriptional regulator